MTRAEQRLNSNHGRLMHAARAVPARLRAVPMPGLGTTPHDVLAHVLAWQEEALRHLAQPETPWPPDHEAGPPCAMPWDDIVARLEENHLELRRRLTDDPPRWIGPCTYWHYTEHTRALLAFLRSFDQPSTAKPDFADALVHGIGGAAIR